MPQHMLVTNGIVWLVDEDIYFIGALVAFCWLFYLLTEFVTQRGYTHVISSVHYFVCSWCRPLWGYASGLLRNLASPADAG